VYIVASSVSVDLIDNTCRFPSLIISIPFCLDPFISSPFFSLDKKKLKSLVLIKFTKSRFFYHVTVGWGLPPIKHSNVTGSPAKTILSFTGLIK